MKVFFATPAYSGAVTLGYLASMMQSAEALRQAGAGFALSFLEGDALVGRARNILAGRFLESDCTHLFFVDADLEWDAPAPLRMVEADKAMVMGIYPTKGESLDFPVSFETDVNGSAKMVNGLLPVKHGPAGFLCIRRDALERMIEKFPELKYEGGFNLFQTEVKDGVFWGEDTAFCERWRSISGAIWAMPDITFRHVGANKWTGNFWKSHTGAA